MHELGIVKHVIQTLEQVAQAHQLTTISSVTLEIGEVSTIIPDYLIDVWNWNCKRVPLLEGCALNVEQIHAVTHCDGCGKDYDTVPQGKICPHCGSDQTWLLTGNEVNIKDITIV